MTDFNGVFSFYFEKADLRSHFKPTPKILPNFSPFFSHFSLKSFDALWCGVLTIDFNESFITQLEKKNVIKSFLKREKMMNFQLFHSCLPSSTKAFKILLLKLIFYSCVPPLIWHNINQFLKKFKGRCTAMTYF